MTTKYFKKIIMMVLTFSFVFFLFNYSVMGSVIREENKKGILNKANSLQIPFIENKGQIKDESVKYYVKTFGGTVFITKDRMIVYSLPQYEEGKIVTGWGITESFIGSFISDVKGEEKATTKVNYFKGKDPAKWRRNIPTYGLVNLGEIYKGIELQLKAYGNNIEKLFYVKPLAHSEIIKIKIDGAKNLKVNEKGELELETSLGSVKFTKPYAYQVKDGKRRLVKVTYTVKGNEYSFKVGDYDKTKELVIDPLLASTFLGGTDNWDWARSIATDSSGNVYVAGYTRASDFPVTIGAYDTTYNDASDVFISKLDSNLQKLLASTFLGGDSDDEARSIAIDSSGNIYVAGITNSWYFPTTPDAYQPEHRWGRVGSDVFISKLDSNLENLLASTFLSGSDGGAEDEAYCISIESTGNVYVAGGTNSPNFPITSGAYDTTHPANPDAIVCQYEAFVSKLDSNLQKLLASTFLGGDEDSEIAYCIAIDSTGNVYVAGDTPSSDFPTTPGAYDPIHNGNSDVFVSKLDSNLQNLLVSTFLGGDSTDELGYDTPQQTDKCLLIDSSGNIYVTGLTWSLNFPTTPDAYSTTREYGGTFVSKLDGNLANLLASTFLCDGVSRSIAIDGSGNIFIAGDGDQPDCQTPPDAYQTDENGWGDAYVIKLDSHLQNLLAATFLGGSDRESILSLALDSNSNIYVSGRTHSSDFPTVDSSYDTTFNGGGEDSFVAKLDSNLSADTAPTTTTTVPAFCPLEEIYGEYSEETEFLRNFRDVILSQTPEGQEIIRLYYEWSSAIVKAMEGDEKFKGEIKEIIDGILPTIRELVE